MHFASHATLPAFPRFCTVRLSKKKVPTSFWHGHLPFWVGGRGRTKDFAFLVAPSFHLSLAVRLQAGLLATKVQNTSPDLHALGAFGRRVTCSLCKCLSIARNENGEISATALQRNLGRHLHDGPRPAAESS